MSPRCTQMSKEQSAPVRKSLRANLDVAIELTATMHADQQLSIKSLALKMLIEDMVSLNRDAAADWCLATLHEVCAIGGAPSDMVFRAVAREEQFRAFGALAAADLKSRKAAK